MAKLWFWGAIFASVYQFGCDQFDWPKLPVLWGMTGVLVPWWGWLLIAQIGFTYGVFEYVRRLPQVTIPDELAQLHQRIARAEERLDGAQVVSAVGSTAKSKPPKQVVVLPLVDNTDLPAPPAEEQKPLSEQERGPCLQALIETGEFIRLDVAKFHHELSEARASANLSGLLPNARRFKRSADTLLTNARMLQATHGKSLKRLAGPELGSLLEALADLINKLAGVEEAVNWSKPAQMERVVPMDRAHAKVTEAAASVVRVIETKRAQNFA